MRETTKRRLDRRRVKALLHRRTARVGAAYGLIAIALGLTIVFGFPGLGWESQRLLLVLLAMGLPVALLLAWAAETAPHAPPAASAAIERADAPTVWQRVQAEFFRLVELNPASRGEDLAAMAGRDPALATEVEALLKAHDHPGVLEELGERIAGVVTGPTNTTAGGQGHGASTSSPKGSAETGPGRNDDLKNEGLT